MSTKPTITVRVREKTPSKRKLTPFQKLLRKRYTRLSKDGTLKLVIDHQSFELFALSWFKDDYENAVWMRDMLAIALDRLINTGAHVCPVHPHYKAQRKPSNSLVSTPNCSCQVFWEMHERHRNPELSQFGLFGAL